MKAKRGGQGAGKADVACWLLKTEPGDYSFADVERDGRTVWDGVASAPALTHLRAVRRGDEAIIYHR